MNLLSVSVSGLNPQEYDLTELRRAWYWETDFYPVWVLGRVIFSLCRCQARAQHWIKILHPWVQEFYPVFGLGSGGRLLRHFLPRPICRNVLEDFCCTKFGGFSRGFSWRIFLGTFSHKNEEKKSGEKIREKIRRLKIKNPRKIRSAESRP